ncbi:MAG TPA: M48 family metallopeptidase [Dongiaceae bacterium]|jgi:heat shock protein HtpX
MAAIGPGPWGSKPAPKPAPEPAAPAPTPSERPALRVLSTDFVAAQRANRRNTIWLIVILIALAGTLGYLIGLVFDVYFTADPKQIDDLELAAYLTVPSAAGVIVSGGLMSIGLIASAVAFAAGGRVMMSLTGAEEVTKEQEPMLHNVVEEMAIAAGLPKPKVVVINTGALNAFAAGMEPESAVIGVTRGLLMDLNREELQGVIAHEMSHILNWDTRYMTAVGIMVGLIALVCDGVLRAGRVGFGTGRTGGKGKGGGAAILMIVLLIFAILAPIAAQMVRFAVSRQREYLADATSVQLTRNPLGLMHALQKLHDHAQPFDGANRATQHMFIVNPFKEFSADASALMATHPAIEDRIERLSDLGAA